MVKNFGKEATDVLSFLDSVCSALRIPVYGVIENVLEDNSSVISFGSWLGGKPNRPSRAPYVAQCKAGELVYAGENFGLSLSPVSNLDISHRWKGAIRFDSHILAISGSSQEIDQLIAAIGIFYLRCGGITLHHAGFSCNKMQFEAAQQIEKGIILDEETRKRIYVPFDDKNSSFGKYYQEYFWYPKDPGYNTSVHLDFVCVGNTKSFLEFLADIIGGIPTYFESEGNCPVGEIFIEDSNKKEIGIMVRTNFWDVR